MVPVIPYTFRLGVLRRFTLCVRPAVSASRRPKQLADELERQRQLVVSRRRPPLYRPMRGTEVPPRVPAGVHLRRVRVVSRPPKTCSLAVAILRRGLRRPVPVPSPASG